ncbi:MAG: hypothetical protein M1129_00800 [Candidatus Thermoplasmatota archaeon]|jgi:hypothetical protein|nr:hypothetical protein [Candidatus Thermoplasmatota archaeon]MCL5954977.1 hypothetical protein [Candidatus Thermoplasmatota archaeon]
MVKITSQGTMVLPFQRIQELLKTVDTGSNKFHTARNIVTDNMANKNQEIAIGSIDFEVSGNRVTVTCDTTGKSVKEAFKRSFDVVYEVMSELLELTLREKDIENEDTLMAIRDITIVSVSEE